MRMRFSGLQQDLEKALMSSGTVDTKTAKKFNDTQTALAVTDVVTGAGAAIATPAVAGAVGLGAAASAGGIAGTAALAAAFPVGTIIVAVPLAVSLGLSIAGDNADKKGKALTKDQEYLMELVEKYKKKDSKWRQKKAKDWLKDYSKHLNEGNKDTLGKKKNKSEDRWKAKKAVLEMDLTAIYIAEYKTTPPQPQTKQQQEKSKNIVEKIQNQQKKAGELTSPFNISGGRLLFDKSKLQKMNTRMLQRPTEVVRTIEQKPQAAPQPIALTLKENPAVLDGALNIPGKKDGGMSKGLIGAGVLGVLGIASILI